MSSEASDRCQQEKRKTINGEDLLWAIQSLGFENYAEPLKIFLSKYRDSLKPSNTVSMVHHYKNNLDHSGAGGMVTDYVNMYTHQQQQQYMGVGQQQQLGVDGSVQQQQQYYPADFSAQQQQQQSQ